MGQKVTATWSPSTTAFLLGATALGIPLITQRSSVQIRPPQPIVAFYPTPDADDAVSVFLAWVVRRVDVLDASWSDEMNLDYGSFVAPPTIVRMLRRVHPERAGLHQLARPLERFAHAGPETPADHRSVLGEGVDVRRDVVVGRELEALDHYFTSFHRIADEDGDLATLWDVGMIPPCQRVGRQSHVVASSAGAGPDSNPCLRSATPGGLRACKATKYAPRGASLPESLLRV